MYIWLCYLCEIQFMCEKMNSQFKREKNCSTNHELVFSPEIQQKVTFVVNCEQREPDDRRCWTFLKSDFTACSLHVWGFSAPAGPWFLKLPGPSVKNIKVRRRNTWTYNKHVQPHPSDFTETWQRTGSLLQEEWNWKSPENVLQLVTRTEPVQICSHLTEPDSDPRSGMIQQKTRGMMRSGLRERAARSEDALTRFPEFFISFIRPRWTSREPAQCVKQTNKQTNKPEWISSSFKRRSCRRTETLTGGRGSESTRREEPWRCCAELCGNKLDDAEVMKRAELGVMARRDPHNEAAAAFMSFRKSEFQFKLAGVLGAEPFKFQFFFQNGKKIVGYS